MAEDPRYPQWLARDEETVALYVAMTEVLAEAGLAHGPPAIAWIPSEDFRRHYLN